MIESPWTAFTVHGGLYARILKFFQADTIHYCFAVRPRIVRAGVSSQPLPTNRTLLERMLHTCEECHASLFRGLQRDISRRDILTNALKGVITPDAMEKRRQELDAASNAELDKGVPSVEFLVPYFDDDLYREARLKIEFGNEAAEEGNVRMHNDRTFVSMIAYGYDAIVHGQSTRLECLRELRERLLEALEGEWAPSWDRGTNILQFQGKTARNVRGKSVAGNIRLVLDEFQRLDWPKQIQTDVLFTSDVTGETVRSLNRGLSLLKFHSMENGKVVYWEVL